MKSFLIFLTCLTLGYQSIATASVAENIVSRDIVKARNERTTNKIEVNSSLLDDLKTKKSKYVYPVKVWQKRIEGNLVLFSDYNTFYFTVDFEGPYFGELMFFTINDDEEVEYVASITNYEIEDFDGVESIVHDIDAFSIYSSVNPASQVIIMD